MLTWQFKEGEFNALYYAMGLDLIGRNPSEYIGRRNLLKIKYRNESNLLHRAGSQTVNYDVVTKDKFYANSILSANGIPVIETLALISESHLIYPNREVADINTIAEFTSPFFVKSLILEAGEGNYVCQKVNNQIKVNGELKNMVEFVKFLGNGKWVIQKKYSSHSSLQRINSSALNTTRIVTVMSPGGPVYLCGFQGFATGGATSDSWQHGSIYVGIDVENTCLKGVGITSVQDKREGTMTKHPDSGILFKGYKIPYLKEAITLCIEAHRLFYFSFIIGWDVAITDDGPLILEANERPGMNVAQALDGGMKKRILSVHRQWEEDLQT